MALSRTEAGLRFQTDGDQLPDGDTEALFEYGRAVPHADAGMLGPVIRTLARAHGWDASASNRTPTGIEVAVSGIGHHRPTGPSREGERAGNP